VSRLLSDEATQYLQNASVVRGSYPATIAGWFCLDENTQSTVLEVGDGNAWYYRMWINNLDIVGTIRDAGGTRDAYGGSVTLNQWHHGCFVLVSSTDRTIYLDADTGTQNVTNTIMEAYSETNIGVRGIVPDGYFSGKLADVAVWGVALNRADREALYSGRRPSDVRRADLLG
jgi:hypothetical protein